MALSDEDVREILRLVDESGLDELRIETDGLRLHVRRDGARGEPAAPAFSAPAAAPASEPERPASLPARAAGPTVEAPMLGTFYRAEGPGEPPLVAVGDLIEEDTVVCLIEVMKLMNHIQAGVAGTVAEVVAEDGMLVEFGQPLFRLA